MVTLTNVLFNRVFIVGRSEGVNGVETKAYAVFGRLASQRFGPRICSEQTGYYGKDIVEY